MSASSAIIRSVHNGSSHRVKDGEKSEILASIVDSPGVSRKGLAQTHAYRPSTVSAVVQELIYDGLIVQRPVHATAGKGRPEVGLEFAPDRLLAIAVYIVSHEVRAALVNMDSTVLREEIVDLPEACTNKKMIAAISRIVARVRTQAPASAEVLGLSLALPGYVDRARRRWLYNSRWPHVRDLDVELIEQATGLTCVLTRFPDAELEHLVLEHPEYQTGGVLLLHWGFGIGASYSHNGSVLRSTRGGFLEVGHWQVPEAGTRECPCGSRGCVEVIAAMWSLVPRLRLTYPDCPDDEYLFGEYLTQSDLARSGHLDEGLVVVARVLAQLYTVFFPDHLLAFGPFFRDREIENRVRQEMLNSIPPTPQARPTLQVITDRFEGSVVGSVASLFRRTMRSMLIARW